MAKAKSKTQKKVAEAFHEVMHNEPSTVSRADVSEERKGKMRVAIALNKARKSGAKVPRKSSKASY